jgi:hypothetical protein
MISTAPVPATHDEAIEAARADVARAETELEATRKAIEVGRAEAARLAEAMAAPPSQHDRLIDALGAPTSARTWRGVPRALELAQHRISNVERALREARAQLGALEASRVDDVDDAMDVAKRAMVDAGRREAVAARELPAARDALRRAATAQALGEATPADVDAASTRVAELEAAISGAGEESARQADLLEGLRERRAQVVAAADRERGAAFAAEWRGHQVELARAARAYATAGAEIVRLADAHPELLRLVDGRAGLWADEQLAMIVRNADYLALRGGAG